MGRFLRSAWSNIIGALAVAIGALPVVEVVELAKSGEIVGVLVTAIGGFLIGGGRGTEDND